MRVLNFKRIIISILLVQFLSVFLLINEAKSEFVYQCSRYTEDHDWWNPFDWFSDYEIVDRYIDLWVDGNTVVINEVTFCSGHGDITCPSCGSSLLIQPNDNILNQTFLDNSMSLLEDYFLNELNNGNYSGYYSNNSYYNNNYILRNVTWVHDTTNSSISVEYYIAPSTLP